MAITGILSISASSMMLMPSPVFAAARHADDDGVCRQVLRIIQHVVVASLARRDVKRLSEIKCAKRFEIRHGFAGDEIAAD